MRVNYQQNKQRSTWLLGHVLIWLSTHMSTQCDSKDQYQIITSTGQGRYKQHTLSRYYYVINIGKSRSHVQIDQSWGSKPLSLHFRTKSVPSRSTISHEHHSRLPITSDKDNTHLHNYSGKQEHHLIYLYRTPWLGIFLHPTDVNSLMNSILECSGWYFTCYSRWKAWISLWRLSLVVIAKYLTHEVHAIMSMLQRYVGSGDIYGTKTKHPMMPQSEHARLIDRAVRSFPAQ